MAFTSDGGGPIRNTTLALDVVVPVYNEEGDLEPSVRRLHAYLSTQLPVTSGSPSRTTPAPTTPGDRQRLASELSGVEPSTWPARAAAARCTRLDGSRGRRARLHGRRPVHRPGRAAAAGRSADLRALATWRSAPGCARLPGGPRPKREFISRCYNLLLQPRSRPLLRRPVRVQGHPRRHARDHCCHSSRTPAGSSTPNCWSWPSARPANPRGAGRLGRRPRLPGRHRHHRQGRPRASPDVGRALASGALPLTEIRRATRAGAAGARHPGVPTG